MVKILSQAGRSLADMYDVVGSVAGIEQLETRELPIVHEMGSTVFSERFRTTFRRRDTGAILQTVNADMLIDNMPVGISRILGVQVLADDASRVSHCSVSLFDPVAGGGQDFPIWIFDSGNADPFTTFLFEDEGSQVTRQLLRPVPGLLLPSFIVTDPNVASMSQITAHALSTTFGAGTVEITLLVHFAFTFTGGVSAFGARIPSW